MDDVPIYMKIYNNIRDDIASGKYAVGDMIPTEKEIAERFGVSRITSKRAFELLVERRLIRRIRGKGSFVLSKDEQQKTAASDAENPAETIIIGLVVSDYSESYGLKLIYGIEEETASHRCVIVPKRTFGDQTLEEESIDVLINLGVKGLIIMPVHGEHYNTKIVRLILEGFPVVLIDRNLSGIPASFVGTNNEAAAKEATDYLLEAGHRHIGFLSAPPKDTSTIEDRIAGFIRSHADYGVATDKSIWCLNLTSTMPNHRDKENKDSDLRQIQTLLHDNPEITCLFASEYNLALLALEAAGLVNLRVPEDVSILCFDSPTGTIGSDFFTHVRQKEHEMGVIAVRLLLEQLQGKKECRKVYLDTDLIKGRSTASPVVQNKIPG